MTYVILSFVDSFRHTSAKMKNDRQFVVLTFDSYQNMSNFMINYESVSARPRFRLNPEPNPFTLYSYNPNFGIFVIKKKLLDSC